MKSPHNLSPPWFPLDRVASICPEMLALMIESALVPTGRLQSVHRDWEYQAGWVRAPLREIVFNDRLSKQARFVWLWLASLPVDTTGVSWSECETLLRCSTSARRRCLAQLVEEGYVVIDDSGRVSITNPYQVFDSRRAEILGEIREEWDDTLDVIEKAETATKYNQTAVMEKKIDIQVAKLKKTSEMPPKSTPAPSKSSTIANSIIEAWNECKPDSYSTIRTVSSRQQECIKKHLSNLGLKGEDAKELICSVCNGLRKSTFWTNTVDQSGRNFNSVFGYGSPQDKKMKNIENLYAAGHEDLPEITRVVKKTYSSEQQDLIDSYTYVKMNYENAKLIENENDAQRWLGFLEQSIASLAKAGIDFNDL